VHKWERNELGDAAGAALERAEAEKVERNGAGGLDVAEHECARSAQAGAVGSLDDRQPLPRCELVRADDGAHLVVVVIA
jgi:hypothetical protein